MKKGNRPLYIGIALVLAFMSIPALLGWSSTGLGDPVNDIFKRIEKVQQYVIDQKLKSELNLSDTQVASLKDILKESNANRSAVLRQRIQIVDSVESGKLSDEELTIALTDLDALDDQFLDLEKAKRAQLRAVLTTEQKAKYTVMRRETIRKVMKVLKPLL